jgi:hypothetical protein
MGSGYVERTGARVLEFRRSRVLFGGSHTERDGIQDFPEAIGGCPVMNGRLGTRSIAKQPACEGHFRQWQRNMEPARQLAH